MRWLDPKRGYATPGPSSHGLRSRVSASLLVGAFGWGAAILGLLVPVGLLVGAQMNLGAGFVWSAIVVFLGLFATMLAGIGHHEHSRFGIANGFTLGRGAVAAFFAAVLVFASRFEALETAGWQWSLAGLTLLALALDGLDGFFARRQGLASRFGARFDMEVDAFLILLLCALVFAFGKAGAFVLLIGAMRYLFIAAGYVWPWLTRDLFPSFRRKTVCVIQGVGLGLLILPLMQPPRSSALALATLATLLWSFAVDTLWLYRHRRGRAA